MTNYRRPPDFPERIKALDTTRSFIIQAPAGSGKTELLVQRLLVLLAVSEKPEEILSITFTRKAASEMKVRLIRTLEMANDSVQPKEPYARETWLLARDVLDRDREMGWHLLQNPSRLQITTIDSFCAYLTRRMPWMSRFGAPPAITDNPEKHYLEATETLLSRINSNDRGCPPLERLLEHLDNRLTLLRDMIVDMLGRRDQWLRHLVDKTKQSPRRVLESGLQLYVSSRLESLYKSIGPDLYREVRELTLYAAENLKEHQPGHPFLLLLDHPEDLCSLGQWLAMAHLVLTASGEVRKSVNKNIGFPANNNMGGYKSRAISLLQTIREDLSLTLGFQDLYRLPGQYYSNEQWQILEALIELLPLAVVELQDIFRRTGQVDFIEVSGAARKALGHSMAPEDLLLQLDSRLRHILVDEFQDTSYGQYDLLRCLTAGWEPADGRTLFFVGDPMQSIYRFREAEVGLYLRVCQRGFETIPMDRIVLTTNFRSCKTLVTWFNNTFEQLFPSNPDEVRGAVSFNHAQGFNSSNKETPVSIQCFIDRQDDLEADSVVELVESTKRSDPQGTIAVLVRSRTHLAHIIKLFKKKGLRYQAQDIDSLTERPAVLDILSLIRAIHHPADRIAWLSILRAPWCGLLLEDLLRICGTEARTPIWQLLTQEPDQIEMFDQVSQDGRERIKRFVPVMARSLSLRGRVSLRQLVESTWLALGGAACIQEADLLDVHQAFQMLDEIESHFVVEDLENQLKRLFAAPDPLADHRLQVMTIHKAKGLEFDTVILPGLGRGVRPGQRDLLRWLEDPDYGLLLAPIPPYSGDQSDSTYKAIGHVLNDKNTLETLRLFYVAVTRAKKRLCLLGHVKSDKNHCLTPLSGSLLASAWPSLASDFIPKARKSSVLHQETRLPIEFSRLPSAWQLPKFNNLSLELGTPLIQQASKSGHYMETRLLSRRTEEGKVVGTLVHYWLDRIASQGLESWSEDRLASLTGWLNAQLMNLGTPHSRLEECIRRIQSCLGNALRSERGRWILGAHEGAASEMAIHGYLGGQLVRATIDRTFLDGEGIRWIIDYKTSKPDSKEEEMKFLLKEKERYSEQLRIYKLLANELFHDQEIICGLYFPAFNGWIETDS